MGAGSMRRAKMGIDAASKPVRRSERIGRNKQDSNRKEQAMCSAVIPSPTVDAGIKRRTAASKRGRSAKRSNKPNPGRIEELKTARPIRPRRDKRNKSKPSHGSGYLTSDLCDDEIPIPDSVVENWDFVYSASQPYQSEKQIAGDEDKSYCDPEEVFNRKWGYLPPLDEEATRIINIIIANPAMAASQSRIQAGTSAFGKGLGDRNVNLRPSNKLDSCKKHIQSLDVQNFMSEPKDEEKGHEALWKRDQAKITETFSETVFQRTIMSSLIARHVLIYQRNSHEQQMFEFSVEEPWTCFPMPSRALNRTLALDENYVAPQNRLLTQPKPDVAVSFNRRAIISDNIWKTLTWPMQNLASFEKVDESNFNVFHFLCIEAENSEKSVDGRKALHQCSNCASQALFNFYEFFHDAGPEHEKAFFGKVRFFSIIANSTGLLVRIHRAVEIPKESRARRVIPQDADYLLEYEFQELARLEGMDQFCRSNALDMIKRLLKYAKETICPVIQNAASALCTKLNDPDPTFLLSRSDTNVYRHGQSGIGYQKKSS